MDSLPILVFLRWTNEHGIWDLTQTIVLLVSLLAAIKLVFFPRRRIPRLDFWTEMRRDHPQYKRSVTLHVQNYTGRSLVLSWPYFRYDKLRPHDTAAGDAPSGDYQLKFPNSTNTLFSEVEVLLRNKESVHTLIPFDDAIAEADLEVAMKAGQLGRVECMVTWLDTTPKTHKLVRRL